ncbi:MAG: RluA family pseudouridine synthase [Minisyncoccia bacterium]
MIDLSKNILYEDSDLLVINKPAGLVVHPDGRTKEPSVSEWFEKKFPEARSVGEPLELETGEILERTGVVHRIDRETSGALILAKTKKGHAALKKQFQNREVSKIYHLFVAGDLKRDQGTIDLAIGRSINDFRKRSAERITRGEKREALTHFRVLRKPSDKTSTFVEARPKTGRTHQIRVHFKAIGHPVVADKLYAPKGKSILGFKRLALHARAVTFKNLSGQEVAVEAPYPEDFEQALSGLKENAPHHLGAS